MLFLISSLWCVFHDHANRLSVKVRAHEALTSSERLEAFHLQIQATSSEWDQSNRRSAPSLPPIRLRAQVNRFPWKSSQFDRSFANHLRTTRWKICFVSSTILQTSFQSLYIKIANLWHSIHSTRKRWIVWCLRRETYRWKFFPLRCRHHTPLTRACHRHGKSCSVMSVSPTHHPLHPQPPLVALSPPVRAHHRHSCQTLRQL